MGKDIIDTINEPAGCDSAPVERLVRPQKNITHEMLHAAVKEAVKLGVIPKYGDEDSYLKNWQNIEKILTASLEAA